MILLIVTLLMILGTTFVVYMSFHKRVVIQRTKLPRRFALYREFVGNYPKVMSQIYTEFFRDICGFFYRDALSFGIYYDNLSRLENPNQARGIVGIYVFEEEVGTAQAFAVSHKGYRFTIFPETDALFTRMTYRNNLSFVWARFKIFPAFFAYLNQHKLVKNIYTDVNGIIEHYYWRDSNKTTEFILPFGPHIQEYYQTTAPIPQPKLKTLWSY